MATRANLLVVDDELIVRDSLDKWFREEGYDVTVADSAQDALAKMAARKFDLALVDIKMPGTDGVELQRRMHEIDPDMLVIIMTGYASVETAVAALKNGAYDYVSKPFDPDDIAHTVHNALSHKRAQQENARLRETVASVVRPQEIVGQSAAMIRVLRPFRPLGRPMPRCLSLARAARARNSARGLFMPPARATTTPWWSSIAAR